MAQWEVSQLTKSLQQEMFHSVYFLYGEESYLIKQAVKQIKEAVLKDGAIDFNFDAYYAADADINSVRDAVETLPMMAARRVVLLQEAQDLSDKEWTHLEPVIENPVESSVFIITSSKVDKRKKYIKILLDNAACVEFKKPFENQIPTWIQQICHAHGLKIQNDALQLLHRLAGNQLSEIESEIKKLSQFLGDRKLIELSDVAACVSRSREENVFDLTNAIGQNDRMKALYHLVHLLDQGQSEVGIVSLISRHIRILLMIKNGQNSGLSGVKLAAYAQVPPYYLNDYTNQSKLWSIKRLEETLLILSETDKALKSSPLSSHIWLENLILKSCSEDKYGMRQL